MPRSLRSVRGKTGSIAGRSRTGKYLGGKFERVVGKSNYFFVM